MKTARFVLCPRQIGDLIDCEETAVLLPYRVVKTVELGAIDYENFITDMLVEREFLESAARLWGVGEAMWCIKVKRKGCTGGILVVPNNKCFVGWAACIPKE